MKQLTLTLFFIFSVFQLSAADKQKAWSRFQVQYAARIARKVFVGTVSDIKKGAYLKANKRNMRDVLIVSVDRSIKKVKAGRNEYLLYSHRELNIKKGQRYLFSAFHKNTLSFYDAPCLIIGDNVRIGKKEYPLNLVLKWIKAGLKGGRRAFWKKNKAYVRLKRIVNRQKDFLHRMRMKEAWLLYRINKSKSLLEKVMMLLELGHTRINRKQYKKAGAAFLYIKNKFNLGILAWLKADQGLAIIKYYQGKTEEAVTDLLALLKKVDVKNKHRAGIYIDLARLYEKQGKKGLAEKMYLKVSGGAHYNHERRAFALFNLGELKRENKDYRRALIYYYRARQIFGRQLSSFFGKGKNRFPAYYFVLKRRIRRKGH